VRLSAITGSLVLHSALIAAAFTLPAPRERRKSDPVTVDLFTRKKEAPPKTAEPPPEPQKLAVREPRERKPEPTERSLEPARPPKEPSVEPPPKEPSATPAPPGKVDLTLHALPTGPESAVSVPSGTGTFGTTPGTGSGTGKPWRMRGDAGNPLTGKVADEKEERFPLRAIGGGELEYKGKAFSARIARDGRVSFDDKSLRDFKGLSGGFDITDMIMRAKGNDPYRAEKAAFLKETEGMRKKMAQAALKERIQASLARLPAQLDEIWRDPSRPVAERKHLLYETWKDAALSEADVGDSAREASVIVENYVRRYLPRGSEHAFTEDELDKLNRSQRLKFQPYH
jgi:hypothetical protein